MREILFRGKRIDNGEWVYGFYYKAKYYRADKELCDFITIPYPEENFKGSDHIMVMPESVGQYTGLNDDTKWEQLTKSEQEEWLKNHTVEEWNGKKIFEGDIVTSQYCLKNGLNRNSIIEYGKWSCSCYNGVYGWFSNGFVDFRDDYFKVIGNIHDNPELLGGGSNV